MTSVPGAALAAGTLSVGAAAGAVAMVLDLRRSGDLLPEVFLGNVWSALVLSAVALVLVGSPRYRVVGMLFGVGGLGSAIASFAFAWAAWAERSPALEPWSGPGVWVGRWVWMAGPLAAVVVVLLLPEGRATTRWRRRAISAVVAATAVQAMLSALTGTTETDPLSGTAVAVANPWAVAALEPLVWPVFLSTAAVQVAVQVGATIRLTAWWRGETGPTRTGLALLAAFAWVLLMPWGALPVVGPWLEVAALPVFALGVGATLVRLDATTRVVVFRRTYLWVSLTTCVVAAYLVVVTVLSVVLHRAGGASVAVAASGVVALVVAPLRTRLQRSVDRTLYGARVDPYASVAGLSRQLADIGSSDEVLPVVVRTITEELQLPYAAFRLLGPDGEIGGAACGTPRGDLVSLPVDYLDAVVGELVVSTPAPGLPLRPAERRLLTDLARQCGAAAYGVATVLQLRRSRERLVAAREEERRSLRRELHDDLGAALTGVALGVDAASNQVVAGSAASAQLARVREVISAAVDDLRRIIDGLRPPALDELGLVPAIQHRLLTFSAEEGPQMHLEAASALPVLPPAVEVAAYHVAVEAVHNAVRHAGSGHITVRIDTTPSELHLDVIDDGHGFGQADGAGTGLTTMRQRVEEVGGRFDLISGQTGTRVRASLPTGARG